jgi:plastocyanin
MKKIFILYCIISCMAIQASAKIYTITATGHSFTPSSFIAHAGDTIVWKWMDGAHTTTSTSIPPGAASWNSKITSAHPSFTYIPTIAGTYNYQCAFDSAAGMTARFMVTNASRKNSANKMSIITVYPNPATEYLHIKFNHKGLKNGSLPVSLVMVDNNSKMWINKIFKDLADTDLDLQNIPNGTYYLQAQQGDKVYNQQITISH